MTKPDIIVRKFVGKLPAKILPFNMRHLMYWEQYVYYSLDPKWWRFRHKNKKQHFVNKNCVV